MNEEQLVQFQKELQMCADKAKVDCEAGDADHDKYSPTMRVVHTRVSQSALSIGLCIKAVKGEVIQNEADLPVDLKDLHTLLSRATWHIHTLRVRAESYKQQIASAKAPGVPKDEAFLKGLEEKLAAIDNTIQAKHTKLKTLLHDEPVPKNEVN